MQASELAQHLVPVAELVDSLVEAPVVEVE